MNSYQFGFREGYSTTFALSEFVESTLFSFDKGNAFCTVLLDLSQAFDWVDRKILLEKSEYIGINGRMYKLLKSYLTKRKQLVSFWRYESDWEGIDLWVALSTIVFVIYKWSTKTKPV